jgi:hypothetical protein
MGGRKKLSSVLGLAVVLLAAAALRLLLVPAQLPFHYVADEFQAVERALRVGTGNPNPGLFTWPGSLVIYLDFLLYAVYFGVALISGTVSSASEFARLYWTDPTLFYLLARLLSTALGLIAVWAVYYITVRLYKKDSPNDIGRSTAAGLTSAITFALMPQAIISSAQALPDMTATALALAALAVSVGGTAESGWKRAAAAGLLLGFAVASKYHAVLYLIPLAGLCFFTKGTRLGGSKSIAYVCIGSVIGFVMACPFAVLDFPTFAADWSAMLARPGMAAFKSDPLYLLTTTLPLGMSWPLFVLGGFGLVWCVVRRFKGTGLIVGLLALAFILAAIPRPLPPRHLLPLFPAFAIAAGVFAVDMYRSAKYRAGPVFGYVFAISITVILLVVTFGDVKLITWENREDSRTSSLKYVEETIPTGASILAEAVEPDVTSPPVWPNRESLERIGKYRRVEGLGGGERIARLLADPTYPFGEPTYDVYLVEMHDDLDALDVEYAVRCIPEDVRFFAEQAKPPGTSLNAWDERYARFLRERGELLATFSGVGRPGPTVEIYEIKP